MDYKRTYSLRSTNNTFSAIFIFLIEIKICLMHGKIFVKSSVCDVDLNVTCKQTKK